MLITLGLCGYVFEVAAASSNASTARAYVSNEDDESVSVLDTESATKIATIDVGKRPRGLKLSRDGSRLFVAVSGLPKCPPSVPDEECAKRERDLKADGIAVVDTSARKLIKVLAAGSDPEQFAMSNDERLLYVANEDVGLLSVVDVEKGKVTARIKVGQEPEGVALSPDGRWVLVSNESGSSVSVIDTNTLKVTKTVSVGKRPRDMAFAPDGDTVYVSGELDASLNRMSVGGKEPAQRLLQLREEARPMAVVLDPARNRLYLSTGRGGTVAIIDTKEAPRAVRLIKEVQVGKRPWGIALSADGRRLYTANGPSNDVSVVDTATLTEVKRIPVGRSPWGVVLGPTPP
jgi:PQQ-dependent catabolism-associated beta-propeller protein